MIPSVSLRRPCRRTGFLKKTVSQTVRAVGRRITTCTQYFFFLRLMYFSCAMLNRRYAQLTCKVKQGPNEPRHVVFTILVKLCGDEERAQRMETSDA